MAPTDLLLRPAHEMRHRWHHCIYFHHPPVLTQSIGWFCHKYHISFMVLLVLVSALARRVLIVIVHIVHFRLQWWWWRQLLLLRRPWPRLRLSHGPRLRRLHLRVGTCELSRRRPKLLRLYWLPRRPWRESISLSCSSHPAALTSGMPSWSMSRPSMKCTGLVQHALVVPVRSSRGVWLSPLLLAEIVVPSESLL